MKQVRGWNGAYQIHEAMVITSDERGILGTVATGIIDGIIPNYIMEWVDLEGTWRDET